MLKFREEWRSHAGFRAFQNDKQQEVTKICRTELGPMGSLKLLLTGHLHQRKRRETVILREQKKTVKLPVEDDKLTKLLLRMLVQHPC